MSIQDLIAFRLDGCLLIKEVVGQVGDLFCVSPEGDFTVNGESFGRTKMKTRLGTALKRQIGCLSVSPGEWVVRGYGERSFDSRYFGTVKQQNILGKAMPIWVGNHLKKEEEAR